MPSLSPLVNQLQSNNELRGMSDPVAAVGPSMDFPGGSNTFLNVSTFVKKPKDEVVFEEVLPEVQRELVVKYDDNLTSVSNYSYVHKRDDAGNIIFNENADDNQLLVIEPITYKFNTSFINKTINTRFSYFQFPATSIASVDSPEFGKLNQVVDTTFRELRSYNGDTAALEGETFVSDVGNSVASATTVNDAINTVTDAINTAAFNNVSATSTAIEQSAGYYRP